MNRAFLAIAGLCGAAGVATAAAASHSGDANLAIVGNFLLFHAPAFIGLSLLPPKRLSTIAGSILLVGLVLFGGDLAMRSMAGTPLFPMAAPLGGGGLILGWLLVAASALVGDRRTS